MSFLASEPRLSQLYHSFGRKTIALGENDEGLVFLRPPSFCPFAVVFFRQAAVIVSKTFVAIV